MSATDSDFNSDFTSGSFVALGKSGELFPGKTDQEGRRITPTGGSGNRRSIQLSYARKVDSALLYRRILAASIFFIFPTPTLTPTLRRSGGISRGVHGV
jgi:hypothetical protein